ncbi:CopY/TcrY family copper transport repressor [Erysipelothrix urinaevulpis]|uniref:CopY/TcrY family copper transport repressor n=1 Tax=Erysipelothrix urinaevulpis TaxID=2683717 RepID=UPI0013573491|nr:CopY/TcrY family copper transport repressor [Erysipelothrix urinaevulpis]
MDEIIQASPAEWEALRVVWSLKQASSKEISDILLESQGWKNATTKTLLGRLVKKGYLQTEKDGNRFIYSATVSEQAGANKRADDLFSSICSKAVGTTLVEIIKSKDLSFADRDLILQALEVKDFVETVSCDCVAHDCETCSHN